MPEKLFPNPKKNAKHSNSIRCANPDCLQCNYKMPQGAPMNHNMPTYIPNSDGPHDAAVIAKDSMSNPTPTDADALNRELELRLWNDDLTAKEPEQIGEAVGSSFGVCNHVTDKDFVCVSMLLGGIGGERHEASIPKTYPVISEYAARSAGWWLWNNRRGYPWQYAIELHVATFRRPPRNFLTGDGMLLILIEMTKRDFNFQIDGEHEYRVDFWHDDHRIDIEGQGQVDDVTKIPIAVARAALAALAALSEVKS